MDTVLVLTNLPDRDAAMSLAAHLIETGLAACVNVMAPCTSVYRWQGKTETAQEVPVFIKTSAERYAVLEQAIRARHPYDLPEIIALPLCAGLPEYLQWVDAETRTAS